MVDAGSTVGAPNRASVNGWCGTLSNGPMMSSDSASNRLEVRENSPRHRQWSIPSPSAVASTER